MEAWQAAEYQYRMTILLEATIEMEAMKAENKIRELSGKSLAYGEDQFMALINKHGIHHNAAVTASLEVNK